MTSNTRLADSSARTEAALDYLRSRTVKRAFRGYVEWIGRAVGWWTIGYLLFWAVIYFIAGVETLVRLDQPLPAFLHQGLAGIATVLFAGLALAGRAPPLSLDRRDLYRLALGPASEAPVLRLRQNTRRALLLVIGAFIGGVWTLVAPYFFHISTPWAAPALALLALAYGEAGWSRYARREGPAEGRAAGGFTSDVAWLILAAVVTCALSALSGFVGPTLAAFGALSALTSASPVTLIVPAALAAGSLLITRRTLTAGWPRRFLPQSLVLTQLQAMRTFQLIAGMAGIPRARGGGDSGERQRLLAALHDKPGAVRPKRSLPMPPASSPQRRAFAWRTAQALFRRTRLAQAWLVIGSLTAATALLLSSGQVALLVAPVVSTTGELVAATTAGGFGVALGVLLSAAWLAVVTGSAVGPSIPRSNLPINPIARSMGRLTPFALMLGAAVVLVLLLAFVADTWLGAPNLSALLVPAGVSVSQSALAVVATALCCCFTLEKYSSWTGSAPGAWECVLIAALLTAMPAMVAVAFGVPGWALGAQLVVTIIVYLISV